MQIFAGMDLVADVDAVILGQIQQGTALRTVDSATSLRSEESAEERNDLLSAIKRGRNLKSAAAREQPARDSPTPGMGGLLGGEVDKILTLRSKIAADSSDSDSSDDSDWSD